MHDFVLLPIAVLRSRRAWTMLLQIIGLTWLSSYGRDFRLSQQESTLSLSGAAHLYTLAVISILLLEIVAVQYIASAEFWSPGFVQLIPGACLQSPGEGERRDTKGTTEEASLKGSLGLQAI